MQQWPGPALVLWSPWCSVEGTVGICRGVPHFSWRIKNSFTEEMTFEQLGKTKNKNLLGGQWGRGNSRPSEESVQRENHHRHRASGTSEPQNMTKSQGVSRNLNPVRYSLLIYLFLGMFSLLIFLSNFYSWQVEIEQKKSLKPDFEGDEVENPKECGVQWWSPTERPWPESPNRTSSWVAEVQVSTYMTTPCWEQCIGPSCR